MSNTLASLRHKIRGATQLGSVVRAMKAAAASSLGQYEAAVAALGDYQRSVELGLSLCLRQQASLEEPNAASGAADAGSGGGAGAGTSAAGEKSDRPIGILIFGSDQGLVGRFNETIGDFALTALQSLSGPKTVWCVGDRVCSYLDESKLVVSKRFNVPNSIAAVTALVATIQVEIERYTASGRHAEVHVFHNRPQAPTRYAATRQRLLPLDATWRKHLQGIDWPGTPLAEVLGGPPLSLPALVHEHLFISLYKACTESLASENASRLESMQRAEKNIESVSAELRKSLNRIRQSSIDEELFDVLAGFNSLVPVRTNTG